MSGKGRFRNLKLGKDVHRQVKRGASPAYSVPPKERKGHGKGKQPKH